jgi:hypothetical protein
MPGGKSETIKYYLQLYPCGIRRVIGPTEHRLCRPELCMFWGASVQPRVDEGLLCDDGWQGTFRLPQYKHACHVGASGRLRHEKLEKRFWRGPEEGVPKPPSTFDS